MGNLGVFRSVVLPGTIYSMNISHGDDPRLLDGCRLLYICVDDRKHVAGFRSEPATGDWMCGMFKSSCSWCKMLTSERPLEV